MKITFLGTSYGRPEPNRFCSSAVVTVNGKHYVIDAGAPIMTLLMKYGMKFKDIRGVFITHSHADHYMGLVEFTDTTNTNKDFRDANIKVLVPEDSWVKRMYLFFNKTPSDKDRVHYSVYTKGVIYEDENIKITAIPVNHMPKSHAFMLETANERVFFSGDLENGFGDFPKEILSLDSKLLVLEGAHTKLNNPDIIKLIESTKTQHLIINHIWPENNPPEIVNEFLETISPRFDTTLAYDGLQVLL